MTFSKSESKSISKKRCSHLWVCYLMTVYLRILKRILTFYSFFSLLGNAALFCNTFHWNPDNCFSTGPRVCKCAYQSQCYLSFWIPGGMFSMLLLIIAMLFNCKSTLRRQKCMGLCIIYDFNVILKFFNLWFVFLNYY